VLQALLTSLHGPQPNQGQQGVDHGARPRDGPAGTNLKSAPSCLPARPNYHEIMCMASDDSHPRASYHPQQPLVFAPLPHRTAHRPRDFQRQRSLRASLRLDDRQGAGWHRAVVHLKALPRRWIEHLRPCNRRKLHWPWTLTVTSRLLAVYALVHSLLVVQELCDEYLLNSNSNI